MIELFRMNVSAGQDGVESKDVKWLCTVQFLFVCQHGFNTENISLNVLRGGVHVRAFLWTTLAFFVSCPMRSLLFFASRPWRFYMRALVCNILRRRQADHR